MAETVGAKIQLFYSFAKRMPKIIISLFNATRKSQKASIILFFPYSLYYSDFRILRVDLRCKSIEIYRDVIHISLYSKAIH